eukprot:2102007-Amphidinium_carterae.1
MGLSIVPVLQRCLTRDGSTKIAKKHGRAKATGSQTHYYFVAVDCLDKNFVGGTTTSASNSALCAESCRGLLVG